jgi:hypothetical protein
VLTLFIFKLTHKQHNSRSQFSITTHHRNLSPRTTPSISTFRRYIVITSGGEDKGKLGCSGDGSQQAAASAAAKQPRIQRKNLSELGRLLELDPVADYNEVVIVTRWCG